MAGKLNGKVAIITGGNSGIGEVTGQTFASEGAKVILMARRVEQGEAVAQSIRAAGGEATFVACDVGDDQSVLTAVEQAAQVYGEVHLLFNNAGGGAGDYFPEEPQAVWDRVINVNLTGTFRVSQAVWPHIVASGGGCVVNMSSLAAQRGFSPRMQKEFGTTSASYYAAKAGVDALTRYMAGIGGSDNIRVNCVRPGQIHHPRRDPRHLQRPRRRTPRVREDVRLRADRARPRLLTGCRQPGAVPVVRRFPLHYGRDHQH